MTAQELKNSILMRAVQGKLVPQDPDDEPASVLLAKIRAEKEQMMKDGKIKKEPISEIYVDPSDNQHYEKIGKTVKCIEDEIPFEIPESWEWCRLNDIAEYIQRGKSPKYSEIEQIPVIAQKCNQWSGFDIKKAKFIVPETISTYPRERLLQDKDLLWNSTGLGTLGRMAIYENNKNPYGIAVADSHVTVVRMFKTFVIPEYVFLWISSPAVQLYIEAKSEGTTKQKELYVNTVKNHMVPLPPLNEQRKILDKYSNFNLFLNRYNKYEVKNTELETNFPKLLKKSLLQYAIQGKLVPQDPNDEPASVLLERIRTEKEQLIKEGKIKRDKNDSYIYRGSDNSYYEKFADGREVCIDEEIPFEIPESWCWCKVKHISDVKGGKRLPKGYSFSDGITPHCYIRVFDMKNQSISNENNVFISEEVYQQIKNYTISKDDLYITIAGTIGNCGAVPEQFDGMNLTENAVKVTNIKISKKYLLLLLSSPYIHNIFIDKTNVVAQPKLALTRILTTLLPIPPQNEQQRIVNMYSTIIK